MYIVSSLSHTHTFNVYSIIKIKVNYGYLLYDVRSCSYVFIQIHRSCAY